MKKIFLITYSFKNSEMTQPEAIAKAAELGYDGVEIMDLDPETVDTLRRLNMGIVSGMAGLTSEGTIKNAELLHELGVKYISYDMSTPEDFHVPVFYNRESALRATEHYNRIGQIAAREGFKLSYHSHTHEFREENGEYLLQTLVNNTDPNCLALQLDCGWAACAGIDVPAFIRKNAGRVGMLHLKACTRALGPEAVSFIAPADGSRGGPKIPGAMEKKELAEATNGAMRDSIINWREVIDTADEQGCDGYIVERERAYNNPPEIMQCLREDLEHIRSVL